MKVKHNRNQKIIKFLNGRTFYIVLCLCFVAIGVAMWSGVEVLKNKSDTDTSSRNTTAENQSKPSYDTISEPDNTESRPSSSSPSTQSKPEASTPKPSEQTSVGVAKFFIRPLLGEIIKDYSDTELQYSLTFKDMRLHKGVDIAGKYGDSITASGEGVVTDVYKDALLGTVVVIDHGNGIVAKYCGLGAEPSVKKGDKVDSSVQIGSLDDIPSESVEQVHLHLEFTKNGKSVDPLLYFTTK